MNEVLQNILTRRSVRDFSDQTISKEHLETLIKAGLSAPSGRGRQTWKFTGILNQAIITDLATTLGTLLGREGYDFYKPSALILVSNESDSPWGRDDNACALQTIFLAAHSMGIGSVWINQFLDQCDNSELRNILDNLGIPSNHTIYGVAALGYSMSEPKGMVEKIGTYTIIE